MTKYLLKLHAAILLGACSGIFAKLIPLDAPVISFYRMALAAVMLAVIFLARRQSLTLDRTAWKSVATGGVLAIHWMMFYASIKYSNVSVGVVCFTLSGFFTACLSPLFNRTRLSITELGLSSLTIAGILLIFSFDTAMRTGIILDVVSAFLFAVYAILNGRVNKVLPPLTNTLLQMSGGAVVLLPMTYLAASGPAVGSVGNLGLLSLLALCCTVAMCLLLNRSQERISPFTVSLSFNLEPVYSIFLAILIFHEDEQLGLSFYVGLSLIVLSLVLQTLRSRRAVEAV